MLLPPSSEGEPPPRVGIINAVVAARTLMTDLGSVCERNPDACETSGQALVLLGRKFETGTDIVAAGIAAGRALDSGEAAPGAEPAVSHGTLTAADLKPAWSVPEG